MKLCYSVVYCPFIFLFTYFFYLFYLFFFFLGGGGGGGGKGGVKIKQFFYGFVFPPPQTNWCICMFIRSPTGTYDVNATYHSFLI